MWMTGRFLRGDKLSKLQGKTIMLISGCSHQSSCVNVVSRHHVPDPPSGHSTVCVCVGVCVCVHVCSCVFIWKGELITFSLRLGTVGGLHLCLRGAVLLDKSWKKTGRELIRWVSSSWYEHRATHTESGLTSERRALKPKSASQGDAWFDHTHPHTNSLWLVR